MASSPSDHTVLVLGAGASLAEAISHHPRRDRHHPPLDGNFFMRASRRIGLEPQRSERRRLLDRVVARASALGQRDLCGSSPPVSLEEYLGRLYFDMSTAANEANIASYYDLIRLYSSELLDTTNWMIGRTGAIRRLIDRELRSASLSVVTFNHDLLIENALATLSESRHPGAWCFRHSYGINFTVAELLSDGSAEYEWDCPGNRHRHVAIYKLHGSCNWVYRTRNVYPSPQVARGDRTIWLWSNIRLSEAHRMGTGTGGRSSWYMWPLIIPPVYEKHSYITGELRRVWDSAGDVLRRATRVVFWGYSFPRADLHARYFFTALAHDNPALRAPVLINPDPRSQDELWTVLQPEKVSHYRSVAAFLADIA